MQSALFDGVEHARVELLRGFVGVFAGVVAIVLVGDLLGGEQRAPQYRSVNPQGLVPVLVTDEGALTQSLAIIEYLEQIHPQPALLPADPLLGVQRRVETMLTMTGAQNFIEVHPDEPSAVKRFTQEAQAVTTQLLQATQKQAAEIQATGQSVAQMTVSMHEVSKSANDSAAVAKTSLGVAEKGAEAVHHAIRGMNDIREQIQETSKRIKRLGESSQEIGEIVQLISDITEQTNVLALNAAIQAASAGEAGRGFSVVAEEVQRLAERSAEATKHIGAIVKSIQRDTQDAVEAMERSTRGVVEGTRTADEADQALREIHQVSNRLAELIAAISSATQQQAASAAQVAGKMKIILGITQLTTEGTKKTAVSAAKLTALADGLKSSVAGFKVA